MNHSLIMDVTDDIKMKPLYENTKNKITEQTEKRLYIEGVMLKQNLINGNHRIYPDTVLEPAVQTYQKLIKDDRATGEIMHPDYLSLDLKNAAIKIVELRKESPGSNFYFGKALVLESKQGLLLKSLLKDVNMGVSSRGEGSVTESSNAYMVDEYVLRAIDVVSDPSVVEAMMTSINESLYSKCGILSLHEEKKLQLQQNEIIKSTFDVQLRESEFIELINKVIEFTKKHS